MAAHDADQRNTLARTLRLAAADLASAGVVDDLAEGRVEAEVLLAHCVGLERAGLYASLHDILDAESRGRFEALLGRRRAGEPVAYITRRREFYGLPFTVDPRVLIPRPETELLVELGLAEARARERPVLCDVGCGSGCVAAALAVHLPSATIFATEVSADALQVAADNFRSLGIEGRVRLLNGDLLEPLPEPVDTVLANLPYIGTSELVSLPVSVQGFEPRLALDGGADGLDIIGRLIAQLAGRLRGEGAAFLEVGYGQAPRVAQMATSALPHAVTRVHRDLGGVERVVEVRLGR